MYKTKKFKIRPVQDVIEDLKWCAERVGYVRRIFLADGDALVVPTSDLLKILQACYELFPHLERVSSYANPSNLLEKSEQELKEIKEAGLTLIYYGVESGDDEILEKVKKQATTKDMIIGCEKAHRAGMTISVTVILGLAGKKGSERHARLTGKLLSKINPRYISALTLMLGPFEKIYARQMGGDFEFLDKFDFLRELRWLIEELEVKDSIFRSNHASNYLPLKGTLPQDKEKLLEILDYALEHPEILRPEEWRAL